MKALIAAAVLSVAALSVAMADEHGRRPPPPEPGAHAPAGPAADAPRGGGGDGVDGVVDNYQRWGLRRPPPGYAWRRMGDRYGLTSGATGMVFDVVPAGPDREQPRRKRPR